MDVFEKLKTPASSKKNVRFSGKNREKRERLICRASTSVSPKSVLTVAVSFQAGREVVEHVQRRACPSVYRLDPWPACSQRPAAKGRMSRPTPCVKSFRFVISPASDT